MVIYIKKFFIQQKIFFFIRDIHSPSEQCLMKWEVNANVAVLKKFNTIISHFFFLDFYTKWKFFYLWV